MVRHQEDCREDPRGLVACLLETLIMFLRFDEDRIGGLPITLDEINNFKQRTFDCGLEDMHAFEGILLLHMVQ